MNYTLINDDYKYDVLAENIYNREVEYFHYDVDKKNLERAISQLPDGEEKQRYQHNLQMTLDQMNIVSNIHAGLVAQIEDQVAYQAAVERAAAKRAT